MLRKKGPRPTKTSHHKRMSPKVAREPNAREKRFHARTRARGCVVCGGEAEIHHILHAPETGNLRCHELVVALCPGCHRDRADSVHRLGSEAKFKEVHGVDLLLIARLNRLDEFGVKWSEAA